MKHTAAVIDLGTNTYHLLVGSLDARGHIVAHFRERQYVFLYSESKKRIGSQPFERALSAMRRFSHQIEEMGVEMVLANGTEGLRHAENGADLLQAIRQQTGIAVRLINGQQEARYTEIGVNRALQELSDPPTDRLIVDIGGGSVEFVFLTQAGKRVSRSIRVGLGLLYPRYLRGEQLTMQEVVDLRRLLTSRLEEISLLLQGENKPTLVGAAGTFEVLANMLGDRNPTSSVMTMSVPDLRSLLQRIIASDRAERAAMPGLDAARIPMMPVAAVLVDYILDWCRSDRAIVSRYGLKEGVLIEALSPGE